MTTVRNENVPFRWASVCFGLICLLWLVAVSNHSFWLDEVHGAGWKAKQTTLTEWWQDDIAQKESTDSQIPLYVLYIWGYAKFFGASEWALRAANLLWVYFGFYLWFKTSPAHQPLKWGMAAAAACSPFLWYYLNEARPYAMQAGMAFLIAAAIRQLFKKSSDTRGWMAALGFGLVALSGSNMLGEVWAAAAVVITLAVLGWPRSWQLVRQHFVICLVTLFLLAGLGFYYLWTLTAGSRATLVGDTSVKNFAFIFYELFGFVGFGPGRDDLRSHGVTAFRPYFAGLAGYALVLTPVLIAGVRQAWITISRRVLLATLLPSGAAFLFLAYVGFHSHFRILGRHFTPLLVIVLYWLGFGLTRLWNSRHALGRGWAVLFIAASLASCLSLRFLPRHAKDEYRGAAGIARARLQDGKMVWWNADQRGAGYYQVPTATNDASSHVARFFMNPTGEELRAARPPDLIITSKPDVFDAGRAMQEYLRANGFVRATSLVSFTVWERPAPAKD